MSSLTTGIVDNPDLITNIVVNLSNFSSFSELALVSVYALDSITDELTLTDQASVPLAPQGTVTSVVRLQYPTSAEGYEVRCITSNSLVSVSAWGTDAAGNVSAAHRLVAEELASVSILPPGDRVLNENQGIFYPTIPDAITAASPGDSLLVYPGLYVQPTLLVVDKSLRIRGFSADATEVLFDNSLIVSLRIQADDVTIENLHFKGPTFPSGDNWLFEIPQKVYPDTLYRNFTLRNSIIEGGRRNAFIYAQDMSLVNNTFIHTGNRFSLNIAGAHGTTTISGNQFNGSTSSNRCMLFESTGNATYNGLFSLTNNTCTSFTQFVSFDTAGYTNVSILIQANTIDHKTQDGSSVTFVPLGDFAQLISVNIQENIITNPNPNRLAVYIDYSFGGTTIPSNGQIKVYYNVITEALPWGKPTDTVSPIAPVGFSNPAPVGMSLAAFDLVGNIIV